MTLAWVEVRVARRGEPRGLDRAEAELMAGREGDRPVGTEPVVVQAHVRAEAGLAAGGKLVAAAEGPRPPHPLEDAARQQLVNVAQLPFIYKWVAAMPDVHWGIGATIGSVIPTRGAIIPAAVGVDIGCGMMAVQTSLHANHLPDNLHGIRTAIEKAVPHGRTDNGGENDRGAWSDAPAHHAGGVGEDGACATRRSSTSIPSWITSSA